MYILQCCFLFVSLSKLTKLVCAVSVKILIKLSSCLTSFTLSCCFRPTLLRLLCVEETSALCCLIQCLLSFILFCQLQARLIDSKCKCMRIGITQDCCFEQKAIHCFLNYWWQWRKALCLFSFLFCVLKALKELRREECDSPRSLLEDLCVCK